MAENWDKIIKWLAAVGGAIGSLFGGWDTMLKVLVCAMVIDYITGLIVAALGRSRKTDTGHLDSKVGFAGLAKKAMILLVIVLASLLDRVMPGEQAIFRSMMCWFYIANEGLSVLENLALAGVPFPQGVRKALEQLQKKSDETVPGEKQKE